MPRTKPRRPWPRAERVAGEEPRADAVTPARIARAMDMTGARHLSDDESARLLVALRDEYPALQGCEDWDTRLFEACKAQLWETVVPLLQYAAVMLALGRVPRARHQRPNLDAIKYCLHNMGDWTVPAAAMRMPVPSEGGETVTSMVFQLPDGTQIGVQQIASERCPRPPS